MRVGLEEKGEITVKPHMFANIMSTDTFQTYLQMQDPTTVRYLTVPDFEVVSCYLYVSMDTQLGKKKDLSLVNFKSWLLSQVGMHTLLFRVA